MVFCPGLPYAVRLASDTHAPPYCLRSESEEEWGLWILTQAYSKSNRGNIHPYGTRGKDDNCLHCIITVVVWNDRHSRYVFTRCRKTSVRLQLLPIQSLFSYVFAFSVFMSTSATRKRKTNTDGCIISISRSVRDQSELRQVLPGENEQSPIKAGLSSLLLIGRAHHCIVFTWSRYLLFHTTTFRFSDNWIRAASSFTCFSFRQPNKNNICASSFLFFTHWIGYFWFRFLG